MKHICINIFHFLFFSFYSSKIPSLESPSSIAFPGSSSALLYLNFPTSAVDLTLLSHLPSYEKASMHHAHTYVRRACTLSEEERNAKFSPGVKSANKSKYYKIIIAFYSSPPPPNPLQSFVFASGNGKISHANAANAFSCSTIYALSSWQSFSFARNSMQEAL